MEWPIYGLVKGFMILQTGNLVSECYIYNESTFHVFTGAVDLCSIQQDHSVMTYLYKFNSYFMVTLTCAFQSKLIQG
jgi:hypothetical protein